MPGSHRRSTRSRASSLPRATCRSRASSPPPARARARRCSSSSISARCSSRSLRADQRLIAGADRHQRLLELDAVARHAAPARRRCRRRGAVIDSSIFIDSSTSRTSPRGDLVAVGDVDEQDGAGHRRLQRTGQRAEAGAHRALGPRLEMMAVTSDEHDVVVRPRHVASRDAVERDALAPVLTTSTSGRRRGPRSR